MSFIEAISSEKSKKWVIEMEEEVKSMQHNENQELVDL